MGRRKGKGRARRVEVPGVNAWHPLGLINRGFCIVDACSDGHVSVFDGYNKREGTRSNSNPMADKSCLTFGVKNNRFVCRARK